MAALFSRAAIRHSMAARRVEQRFQSSAVASSLIDCSSVRAQKDVFGGVGTFAARPIKAGEVFEKGVVRRVAIDGNKCGHVLSWGEDRASWAMGSGCALFYNNPTFGTDANAEMQRDYDKDRFEMVALRDIEAGEEISRLYKGLEWRDCYAPLRSPLATNTPKTRFLAPDAPASAVDCTQAYAKLDQWGGVGAFASRPFKKGELIEHGLMRRLPIDGNANQFVFTWSEDRTIWATGSGCAMFFNSAVDGSENTKMTRYFDEDRFEIHAMRDIDVDEELTHLYRSMQWRTCFSELKDLRNAKVKQ